MIRIRCCRAWPPLRAVPCRPDRYHLGVVESDITPTRGSPIASSPAIRHWSIELGTFYLTPIPSCLSSPHCSFGIKSFFRRASQGLPGRACLDPVPASCSNSSADRQNAPSMTFACMLVLTCGVGLILWLNPRLSSTWLVFHVQSNDSRSGANRLLGSRVKNHAFHDRETRRCLYWTGVGAGCRESWGPARWVEALVRHPATQGLISNIWPVRDRPARDSIQTGPS